MWYSKMFRRHLCDMHIADWDDSFLSKFSPEKYVEALKLGKVQNAMIYLQSHVGLCYYPTKNGVMHKAFIGREDMMKRTIELCHDNGIAVTGYYSLNYNTAEHDRHPEWRMLQANGISQRGNNEKKTEDEALAFASVKAGRYGLCCPNNHEYREFVYRQIDEMLEYFDVEGMFFDMPFWPHTCHCEKCRERWAREVGGEFPEKEPSGGSELHLTLMRKKYDWMGEWIQAVTDHVRKIAPEISIEHNFASGIAGNSDNGCGEEVNLASDFVGGDLYGGILNHSLACKFYKNITQNAPFDYMFSRCKPALRTHTLTKTEDEMMTEVMMTAAHHGATMVIDAIDPVGTFDTRVYERVGKIFEVQAAYEPYFTGEMVEDVGLYYGMKSRIVTDEKIDSLTASIGAARAMVGEHIPFGVTGVYHSLDKYRALVIPMISSQENDGERIAEYISNGGSVYISGMRDHKLIEKLTGGVFNGYTVENNVYIAPKKGYEKLFSGFNSEYPLPFDMHAPLLSDARNGEVLSTLTLPYTKSNELRFASIHSDPPGIATKYPMVIKGNYGKGSFVWSAVPLENINMPEYSNIFIALLRGLLGEEPLSFVSDAPEDVEITLFENADDVTVNVMHAYERAVMPTLAPFNVGIYVGEREAKRVELLPSGEGMAFEKREGYIEFKVRPLHIFDMYRIVF